MDLQPREQITRFLNHVKETGQAFDDAGARYGVRIESIDVPTGTVYWRAIGVHHLTPEENDFNHHIYVEAVDESGQRITGPHAWAGWTWEGRGSNEEARPQPLDKGAGEPAGNIPMDKGQHVAVWIAGLAQDGADKSDRVVNLHTAHPDERTASGALLNAVFHHSYFVVFQRTRKGAGGVVQPGGQAQEPEKPVPQPGESLPQGATVAFRAQPETIKAGQVTRLQWDVEGVDKVFFGAQGVTGHESRTVTPAATTTYTLRVIFRDGRAREFLVKVVVEAAAPQPKPSNPEPAQPVVSPGATRPPTVRLTAANIAHLRTFPRPQNDNGIGLHFHVDLRDEFITKTVDHLKSIRATWTLIYAQDEKRAEQAARACFHAGIMPVVRIGKLIDEGFDPVPYVDALRKALAGSGFPHDPATPPLYVQIYNEPEDDREWLPHEKPDGWQKPADWPSIFGRNWAQQAARVVAAGGYAGIQVLDRPGFDAAVDAVNRMNRPEIWQRAFFVHHNYGSNHPADYPYDELNQRGAPGQTILGDYTAALRFLAHAAWMQERLGLVLPIIGGEGGWTFGCEEDDRYPKVEAALHAQYHKEMYEWFRTGVLSTGEPLPDYLFSITSWIAGSWDYGGQNWWDNILRSDGKLTETIEAVQSIPSFARKFSWDR